MTASDFSRVFYVSPAYEKLWERPIQEVYENPNRWFEAILKEDQPRVREALGGLSMVKEYKEYIVEYRISRPDGSIRWVGYILVWAAIPVFRPAKYPGSRMRF